MQARVFLLVSANCAGFLVSIVDPTEWCGPISLWHVTQKVLQLRAGSFNQAACSAEAWQLLQLEASCTNGMIFAVSSIWDRLCQTPNDDQQHCHPYRSLPIHTLSLSVRR